MSHQKSRHPRVTGAPDRAAEGRAQRCSTRCRSSPSRTQDTDACSNWDFIRWRSWPDSGNSVAGGRRGGPGRSSAGGDRPRRPGRPALEGPVDGPTGPSAPYGLFRGNFTDSGVPGAPREPTQRISPATLGRPEDFPRGTLPAVAVDGKGPGQRPPPSFARSSHRSGSGLPVGRLVAAPRTRGRRGGAGVDRSESNHRARTRGPRTIRGTGGTGGSCLESESAEPSGPASRSVTDGSVRPRNGAESRRKDAERGFRPR
jgi:hypothetical protein